MYRAVSPKATILDGWQVHGGQGYMAHTDAVAYLSLLACEWPLEAKLAALLSGDQSFISVAVLVTMNLYSFCIFLGFKLHPEIAISCQKPQ